MRVKIVSDENKQGDNSSKSELSHFFPMPSHYFLRYCGLMRPKSYCTVVNRCFL